MASRSRKVALGGVLGGICLISLYLAVFLPTNRIFFYGLSSLFSSIILVEAGHKWAWIFYGATSILGFFIIPNKLGAVPYVLFFGFYGIAKYYIEGIRNMFVELVLKGGLCLLAMGGTFVVVKELFMGEVYSKIPIWGIAILGLVIFCIYDYVYTRFVIYYETVLRKRIL